MMRECAMFNVPGFKRDRSWKNAMTWNPELLSLRVTSWRKGAVMKSRRRRMRRSHRGRETGGTEASQERGGEAGAGAGSGGRGGEAGAEAGAAGIRARSAAGRER